MPSPPCDAMLTEFVSFVGGQRAIFALTRLCRENTEKIGFREKVKTDSAIMNKTKKVTATKFLSQPTPETEKAVDALRQVFDRLGADRAEATYASALSERFLKEWKRSRKVTQSRGNTCVQKIRGKKCALPYSHCECTPPGADHATLWSKRGKPTFYVSQPYELDMATIEEMNEFCKKHELAYDIGASGAFYYPGAALMVVFYHRND